MEFWLEPENVLEASYLMGKQGCRMLGSGLLGSAFTPGRDGEIDTGEERGVGGPQGGSHCPLCSESPILHGTSQITHQFLGAAPVGQVPTLSHFPGYVSS